MIGTKGCLIAVVCVICCQWAHGYDLAEASCSLFTDAAGNCVANDLGLKSAVLSISDVTTTCTALDTNAKATLNLAFEKDGNDLRYDVGLWFPKYNGAGVLGVLGSTGSGSGVCNALTLEDGDYVGSVSPVTDADSDKCMDIDLNLIMPGGNLNFKFTDLEIPCELGADNKFSTTVCIGYNVNDKDVCNGPPEAVPDPGPKCRCFDFTSVEGLTPKLAVTKTFTQTACNKGKVTVTVANTGGTATNVQIVDTLPTNWKYDSLITPSTFTCSDSSDVTCTMSGSLASGASASVTFDVTVAPSAAGITSFTNKVYATSNEILSDGSKVTSPVFTQEGTIVLCPNLTITKTMAATDCFSSSSAIVMTGTITVKNADNAGPANGVVVTDTPGALILATLTADTTFSCGAASCSGALAAGATVVISFTASVPAAGSYQNTASVEYKDSFDMPVTPADPSTSTSTTAAVTVKTCNSRSCTPGWYKQSFNFICWPAAIGRDTTLVAVAPCAGKTATLYKSLTFIDALNGNNGPGGAATALARSFAAAYLNAELFKSGGFNFFKTTDQVVDIFCKALTVGTKTAYGAANQNLDYLNNGNGGVENCPPAKKCLPPIDVVPS